MGASSAPQWDSIWQCNSSLVWQRAALALGNTTESCAAAIAGKIRWTGSAFQGCNGTSWGSLGAGGSTSPGGANTQIQFNNSGAFGASANLVWDDANTRAGIGTASPAATLHVNGEAIVGKTALSCAASTKGALRYDGAADAWTYCNGSSWVPFESAGGGAVACSDASPAAFAFTDQPSVAASTLITSDIVQLTGFDCTIVTAVSGNGSPAYRLCADSACSSVVQDWTTANASATAGQYVQVRLTSSATDNQTYTATLTAGETASTTWSVRTLISNCGPPSAVGTVCPDGTVYAGLSPDGNLPMYTTRCDLGMAWNGSACAGTRSRKTWNSGLGAPDFNTGFTSQITGRSNTSGLAALTGTASPYVAAKACADLAENLYTDWYLPAHNETQVLCNGKGAIGNFSVGVTGSVSYYWSSSEQAASQARFREFAGCTVPSTAAKSWDYNVRCVRRN